MPYATRLFSALYYRTLNWNGCCMSCLTGRPPTSAGLNCISATALRTASENSGWSLLSTLNVDISARPVELANLYRNLEQVPLGKPGAVEVEAADAA